MVTLDGLLQAIDAGSGQSLWHTSLNEPGSDAVAASSPTLNGGALFTLDSEGEVRAFDAKTGCRIWATSLSVETITSSPNIVEGLVYLGTFEGVVALDMRSGGIVWQTDLPGGSGTPMISRGRVFASGRYLYALDSKTGKELWAREDIFAPQVPSTSGEFVYTASTENQRLYALHPDTGETFWMKKWESNNGPILSTAAIISNTLVVTGGFVDPFFSEVYALDAQTGEELWTIRAGELSPSSPPTLVDGLVLVSTEDDLLALDVLTGEVLWLGRKLGGETSPSVVGGVVYVARSLEGVTAYASD